MKIIEGKFGKKQEEDEEGKASELFKGLAEYCEGLEKDGEIVRAVTIVYVDGKEFSVAGNERYPDGVYMLLNMGAEAIMTETMGG